MIKSVIPDLQFLWIVLDDMLLNLQGLPSLLKYGALVILLKFFPVFFRFSGRFDGVWCGEVSHVWRRVGRLSIEILLGPDDESGWAHISWAKWVLNLLLERVLEWSSRPDDELS